MRITVLLTMLGLFALPASAAVLDSSPAGFTVESSQVVPGDTVRAWKVLIEEVDLWWPKDHSWFGKDGRFNIEPRAGGCFCEVSGDRSVQHLQVAFADPGRLLRMTGGLGPLQGMGLHGALDFTLVGVPEGVRITLRYRVGGYDPKGLESWAPLVDKVTGIQLAGLAKRLQDTKP
jgi:hypothetical protein